MSKHKCPICISEFFDTAYSLHLHCVEKHPSRFVCCPICYELFEYGVSNEELVTHSNAVHDRQSKAELKTEDFAPITPYRFDERMVKDNGCVICSMHFRSRVNAINHIKSVHLALRYLCHHCSRIFSRPDSLGRHFRTEHRSKPESVVFAGFGTTEKTVAEMDFNSSISVLEPTGVGIMVPSTSSNPNGSSCAKEETETETNDVADAEMAEENTEETPNVQTPTTNKRRADSPARAGQEIDQSSFASFNSPGSSRTPETESADFAGFGTPEKMNSEYIYNLHVAMEKRLRRMPREGPGLKLLTNPFNFCPNHHASLHKLTFRNARGVVKLRPFAMNDLQDDFDLT